MCFLCSHRTRAGLEEKDEKKGESKEKNADVYTSHPREVEDGGRDGCTHTPCDVSAGIAIRDARDPHRFISRRLFARKS